MKAKLLIPDGYVERPTIMSGAIRRDGFTGCGVVFTTCPNPSPQDLNPDEILNAQVEVIELRGETDDRFLTIEGGYYVEEATDADGKPAMKTTRVFGVASDASQGFEIQEGGFTVLADHWEIDEQAMDVNISNPKNAMDENLHGRQAGWTLIVREVKKRKMYPMSGKGIELVVEVECPQVTGIVTSIKSTTDTHQTIEFTASVEGPEPDSYTWDWGDGSPPQQTSGPTAEHRYERKEHAGGSYTVVLTIVGPENCNNQAEVQVSIPSLPQKPEKPERCKGAGIACWIPFIVFVVLAIFTANQEIETLPAIILLVLDVAWIVFSCRCLCRPYLPFLAKKQDEDCKWGGLACMLPFIMLILVIVFFVIETMMLVPAVITAILLILFIILSWGCLCKPYLPFRR